MESKSHPIKATWIRRALTIVAIKALRRFRPRCGPVLFLTSKICVKYGPILSLSEASTIQFIHQNTGIPVPKIYCAFERKGEVYIVMEKIRGDVLGNVWGRLSDDSKDQIFKQLRSLIDEMRQLRSKTMHVSNVDGGPLCEGRIAGPTYFHGPFDTVHQFHRYITGNLDRVPDEYQEVNDILDTYKAKESPLRFTHADLSSLNILVRNDRVVAIIDWTTSGWYPAYWEYTIAVSMVNPQNYFWAEQVGKFLEPFPDELTMEKVRQKYFGDIPEM